MRHVFETHSNEPNFKFPCCSCGQTFSQYSSMVSHLSRKHRSSDVATATQPVTLQDQGDIFSPEPSTEGHADYLPVDPLLNRSEHFRLRRAAALFLLTLKEKYKLTQTTIDFAVCQVQHMVSYALQDMKDEVQQHVARTLGAELPDLIDIMDTSIDPFEGLQTEYMQTKFFRENFDLTVGYFFQNTNHIQTNVAVHADWVLV